MVAYQSPAILPTVLLINHLPFSPLCCLSITCHSPHCFAYQSPAILPTVLLINHLPFSPLCCLSITCHSPHCVAFPMYIAANCSSSFVYCVTILCVSLLPCVCCFTVCVLLSYIHWLPDCWLEVSIRKVLRPATSARVNPWFPCV
jgi:hypothetical protein